MLVKQHITRDKRLILAVCDSELKGRCLENKKIKLDLGSGFYNGSEASEETALKLIKTAYIINLVGKKSVELGIKAGAIDRSQIVLIEGIPHAQAVVADESNY